MGYILMGVGLLIGLITIFLEKGSKAMSAVTMTSLIVLLTGGIAVMVENPIESLAIVLLSLLFGKLIGGRK